MKIFHISIYIYRPDIFNCCIRTIKRKTFNPFNKISVIFTDIGGQSEGAIDAGGPTREMFRLVLKHIENSSIFMGSKYKFLSLNRNFLENIYYFSGQIIALSIIHGGPGPHFFSEVFYKCIIEGFENCEPSYDFIDYDIVEKIKKLEVMEDLEKMNNYILEETIFTIAGCYTIIKKEDKEMIIKGELFFHFQNKHSLVFTFYYCYKIMGGKK